MGDADIVYEILAEGGVTRMVALYSDISKIGTIGSIRSSRTYYVDIALAFDAIYVHSGGSEAAYGRLQYFDVDRLDGTRGPTGADTFYRDSTRLNAGYAVEHTQFTTGEKIYAFAEEEGYRLTVDETYDSGLRFTDDAVPADGESANNIEVRFVKESKFTKLSYDEAKGIYTAYQLSKDYVDGNNDEKVEFNNVIILMVETAIIDNEGRRDMKLVTEGEGYFACGGKYIPIKWSRSGDHEPFRYYNTDGTDLEISAGRSYIAFVPTTKSAVIFE